MPEKYFVNKDIELYINYISEVKNLSKKGIQGRSAGCKQPTEVFIFF